MRNKYFIIFFIILLSGCMVSPGMHFSEARRQVDGVKSKMVNAGGIQFRLRIVPITKKLLFVQNTVRANSQPAFRLQKKNKADAVYKYRVQPTDILGITLWESAEAVNPAENIGINDIGLGLYGADSGTGIGSTTRRRGGISGHESAVMVDSEGYIYFPFAGEVFVKGLTTTQIRRKMHDNMREYFDEPKLAVRVVDHNSQFAMVTGQVKKPGRIEIGSQPLTVIDAIHESGGLSEDGSWKKTTLSRADGSRITIDLYRIFAKGDLSQNYRIQHKDILHVPQDEGNMAFLYADGNATAMQLQNNTQTLTEAIGNAGGIRGDAANSKKVFVLRREQGRPFGEVTAYHLNAKSPAALVLANSFYLRPKDIVYIETSEILRWNRVISLLLPSTGVLDTVRGIQSSVQGDN